MRYLLINPNWSYHGSIYFGCRDPHLPLEFGYARQILLDAGHEVLLIDGQLEGLELDALRSRARDYRPDFIVVSTAPSYLFWRCAPPELRVPRAVLEALSDQKAVRVAVGPHASTTPGAVLKKLGVELAVLGEPEEILPRLAGRGSGEWETLPSVAWLEGEEVRASGLPHASDMAGLAPLRWPSEWIERHRHHHHRFDGSAGGPGAELEASRGCPYHCSFCAKDNFRDRYRRRPLPVLLDELDALLAQGVEYVYFIDEIFLPDEALLEALARREVCFGVQTRIDLWSLEQLDLLGRAGCRSIEAGVERIDEEGRRALDKRCRLDTAALTERLIHARKSVPFVQASLIASPADDPGAVEAWRGELLRHGVWANKPVPLFPYPGSPDYTRRWGPPDELAWERALSFYLKSFRELSDIQGERPLPLKVLERSDEGGGS